MIERRYQLNKADSDAVFAIVPHQLAVEIIRSGSCALVSDAMRDLTAARRDGRLSEQAYTTMVEAFADVLSPMGARQ
jgi:hypothetical protein